jgi:hypothetical protein
MKARFARALALIPLVALLTGCITYETSVEIKDDANITVSFSLGLEKSYAEMMSVTDMCESFADSSPLGTAAGKPYTTDKEIGCKWVATLTLEEFNRQDATTLTHANGEYVFTVNGSAMGDELGEVGASIDSITGFTYTVTFPGKVTVHSGSSTLSGLGNNTVTWTKTQDMIDGLSATANDTSSVADSLLPILLIVGGVVLVAGGATFAVLKVKKSKAQQAEAAQQAAYYAQAGYGQPVPSYAPQTPYGDPNAGLGAQPYGDPNAAYAAPPQAPYVDPNAAVAQPQAPYVDPNVAPVAPQAPYVDPNGQAGYPPAAQPPYVDPNAQAGYPPTPQPPYVDPNAGQYPPQAPYPPQA